jgi:hypothetical protein
MSVAANSIQDQQTEYVARDGLCTSATNFN